MEEYTRRDLDWKYANPTGDDIILLNSYLERYGDISDERHAEMTEMNIHILAFRCPECRTRLIKYKYFGDNSSVTKEC
ncbi:MAG: hypothetical protein WCX79_01190 [Candidatus Paceibacterota bacterium]